LQGRVHAYEGHPTSRVVFGVRLLVELGCSVVLLSNAAGGIRDDLDPGSLMLIEDHLNLTGINPLTGENPSFGPRFVDLRDAYDPELCALARRAALAAGIPLRSGVYAAMAGPSYETPAEIRMLRTLGADAVGMSTVLEVIALRHRDARVAAVSCITNRAAGLPGAILDHRDVERVAEESSGRFSTLFREWIALIGKVTA
jgi:purine-nucleoside phosphorylase